MIWYCYLATHFNWFPSQLDEFLTAVGRLCYAAYLLDIGRVIASSGEGSRDAQAHLMVISPCLKSYNQIFTIYWSINLPCHSGIYKYQRVT